MNRTIESAVLVLGLLPACLVSCIELTALEQLHSVEVSISANDGVTKAGGIENSSECAVNTIQIFVFNEDGTLETDGFSKVDEGTFSMVLKVSKGKGKIFHAVVNKDEMKGIDTEAALLAGRSVLADNGIGSLVMTGYCEKDIESDCSVTIHVRRLVAKVCLEGIEVRMQDAECDSIQVNAIFLTNVNSALSLGGDSPAAAQDWLNKRGYFPSACDSILYEPCCIRLKNGEHYASAHTFYCYPNPFTEDTHDESADFSERCTRLILDTDLGFYRVDLNYAGGIESNHVYMIRNIIITRPGGDTPENEEKGTLHFNLAIHAWEDAEPYSETI